MLKNGERERHVVLHHLHPIAPWPGNHHRVAPAAKVEEPSRHRASRVAATFSFPTLADQRTLLFPTPCWFWWPPHSICSSWSALIEPSRSPQPAERRSIPAGSTSKVQCSAEHPRNPVQASISAWPWLSGSGERPDSIQRASWSSSGKLLARCPMLAVGMD
jgi:hypothetical protein